MSKLGWVLLGVGVIAAMHYADDHPSPKKRRRKLSANELAREQQKQRSAM